MFVLILHSAFFILHLKWWVATVLPRALRFKKPLHRCNAFNPDARPEGSRHEGGVEPPQPGHCGPQPAPVFVSRESDGHQGVRSLSSGLEGPCGLSSGCIFQHLFPTKWSPVRESHPLAWFCRPLPQLFGQRDYYESADGGFRLRPRCFWAVQSLRPNKVRNASRRNPRA